MGQEGPEGGGGVEGHLRQEEQHEKRQSTSSGTANSPPNHLAGIFLEPTFCQALC